MVIISHAELKEGKKELIYFDKNAPQGAHIHKYRTIDMFSGPIDILTVNNGVLEYTIIFQRGMDIGQMWYEGRQIGWDRSLDFLLNPDNVDLSESATFVDGTQVGGVGWLNGFYAMDAMVGPKHFGGPCVDSKTGEFLTLHDRNSYSLTDMSNVHITIGDGLVSINGIVPIKYSGVAIFERETGVDTFYNSNSLIRVDVTRNISQEPQIVDFGHHIQFGSALLGKGARYVVTAPLEARDDEARKHLKTALEIPAPIEGYFPERCYFIHPRQINRVDGVALFENFNDITAQMVVSPDSSLAGFVAQRLGDYPYVTLWQQYGRWRFDPEQKGPIWYTAAIEPGISFPGPRDDKRAELPVLEPRGAKVALVEIGVVEGIQLRNLEQAILAANK